MTPQDMFSLMVSEGDIVTEKLDEVAARMPQKVFLYYGEQDRAVSYAAFRAEASQLAAALQSLGVAPDDRVCVFTKNSYLGALSMFAVWMAGAVYCPVNFMYRGKLLLQQLRDVAPKVIISDVNLSVMLAEIADECSSPELILHCPRRGDHDFTEATIPGTLRSCMRTHILDELIAGRSPHRPVARSYSDIANIIYTSGTTGPSKGVLQPFRWMNQYTFVYRKFLSSEDVIYCDLPLYHVGGAFFRVAKAVWIGATVALYDRFSASGFWQRVRKTEATHVVLLDVMAPWLMSAEPSARDRDNPLNKVHMQPLPLMHNEIARRFGIDIVTSGYGQTETGGSFISVIDEFPDGYGTPPERSHGLSKQCIRAAADTFGVMTVDGTKPLGKGLMGRPMALFETTILDPHDNPCGDGEIGQLAFRPRFPELLLRGYFNRPEAMVRSSANFWFHTGDACQRDADGVYHFVDRLGGFFRVRGENVSSFEVEDLLNGHPKVQATAAVPARASQGAEEECAVFVQLKAGEVMSTDELLEYARQVMPKYMVPKYVRFTDALPLTSTNKVEKYKLKQALLAELGDS